MTLRFRRIRKPDHAFKTRLVQLTKRPQGGAWSLMRTSARLSPARGPEEVSITARPAQSITEQDLLGAVRTYRPIELCRRGAHSLFMLNEGSAFIGRWISEAEVSILPATFEIPTTIHPHDGSGKFVFAKRLDEEDRLDLRLKTSTGARRSVSLVDPKSPAPPRFDEPFRAAVLLAFETELAAWAISLEEDLEKNRRAARPEWPAALCTLEFATPAARDRAQMALQDLVDEAVWKGFLAPPAAGYFGSLGVCQADRQDGGDLSIGPAGLTCSRAGPAWDLAMERLATEEAFRDCFVVRHPVFLDGRTGLDAPRMDSHLRAECEGQFSNHRRLEMHARFGPPALAMA